MKEADAIARFAALAPEPSPDVLLGIGDDAAALAVPGGEVLVACVDTLNVGTHFLADQPAASVGHRALAVNLSDLAAMGATARWALLSLSLPAPDEAWVVAFAEGFGALAHRHGVQLVGGDTTRGALAATVTALGTAPPDALLRRGRAAVGDRIWVSGTVGDAHLALVEPSAPQARLLYPIPRLALGNALRGLASACLDLSDGLATDLPRLAGASGTEVDAALLPLAPAVAARADGWRLALAGGDDYELCFTAPADADESVRAAGRSTGTPVTPIGRIAAPGAHRVLAPDGAVLDLASIRGFEHW